MRVSRELIEKYHRGECSDEEKYEVEEWLFDDQFDEKSLQLSSERRLEQKKEIWEGIAPVLSEGKAKKGKLKVLVANRAWLSTAAALVLLCGSYWFIFRQSPANHPSIIEANNISDVENRDISSPFYSLSLGPHSNVRIDQRQEMMELCGTLSFTPTENIRMKIVGECPKGLSPQKIVELKGGASYIAFSYQNTAEHTELIVVEQNQLNVLPYFIQKQLITQFKI